MKISKGLHPAGLRVEHSLNYSGKLANEHFIPILPEKDYCIIDRPLDGDAPKQFIRAWMFEENSTVRKAVRKSWPAYIAKTAEKWYPHESVVEYMINRIGQVMGLRMNEVALVKANGQIRFLSKYFLKQSEQRLVHGAEICGQHLGDLDFAKEIADNRGHARALFTFEFIKAAIEEVYPLCCDSLIDDLVRMLTYDALVGNNDRHFYNWGIIDTIRKTSKPPIFAPIYDTARGFYWNHIEQKVVKDFQDLAKGGKKLVNYIEGAAPRISVEANKGANHFELMQFLRSQKNVYDAIVKELASEHREEMVLAMIKKEFGLLFSKERIALITFILQTRFKRVRD